MQNLFGVKETTKMVTYYRCNRCLSIHEEHGRATETIFIMPCQKCTGLAIKTGFLKSGARKMEIFGATVKIKVANANIDSTGDDYGKLH